MARHWPWRRTRWTPYITSGNVLQHLKRYEAALASYQRALALAPRDVEAWNNCAVVLQHLKRHDEALASCEHALALAPGACRGPE